MTPNTLLLASPLLFLAACGGAASSELGGPGGPGDTSGFLTLPSDPKLDAPCGQALFTPRSLLEDIKTKYTATYTREHGESASTGLTMTVAYGGHVVCTPAKTLGGQDPISEPAQINVDLEMTFKTADGTFDETFTATAWANPDLTDLQFSGSVPATALRGTYKISWGPASGDTVSFQGQLNYPKVGDTMGIVGEKTSKISAGEGNW